MTRVFGSFFFENVSYHVEKNQTKHESVVSNRIITVMQSYVDRRSPLQLGFLLFVIIASILINRDQAGPASDSTVVSSMERGKHIQTFQAKDLYQAYQAVQEEYHQRAFVSKDWRVLSSKDDIDVSILLHPSDRSCPYIKMQAIIDVSVEECWNWLRLENWKINMKKMDPFYERHSIVAEKEYKGVSMTLARKCTKRIVTFGKRDFVFVSVADLPKADGTWVSGTVSVISDQLPRERSYTRAFQDSIAFYKPLGKTRTKLTIVCRIDLNDSSEDGKGGAIPMWLYVKTIGATGARSVSNMRSHLEKERQEREARGGLLERVGFPRGGFSRHRSWWQKVMPK